MGDDQGRPCLRGTTWGHPRGYAPILVTAEAHARRSGVPVAFDVRSLQQFADQPLTELTGRYDILVFDHPFIGEAAERGLLEPLEELVPAALLAELAANSVGPSWESYQWAGSTYALPIDTAFHVSAHRRELTGQAPPQDWADAAEFASACARSGGARVALPLRAIDVWCLFVTLCATAGEGLLCGTAGVVEHGTGLRALATLRQLTPHLHPGSWQWDPIQLLDAMSSTDEIAWCPALFGYVNYATTGFRPRLVRFAEAPGWNGRLSRPVIGGAGIAISARSTMKRAAGEYLQYVASRPVQCGAYPAAGGQPGHRAAWQDEHVNACSHGFYEDTLASGDRAFLRPRLPGFIPFQTSAAGLLRAVLAGGLSAEAALTAIDAEYHRVVAAAGQ